MVQDCLQRKDLELLGSPQPNPALQAPERGTQTPNWGESHAERA